MPSRSISTMRALRIEPAFAPLSKFQTVRSHRTLPDPNRTEAAEAARVAQQPPFDAEALVAVLVDNRSWTALAKIGSIYSSHKANGSSTWPSASMT